MFISKLTHFFLTAIFLFFIVGCQEDLPRFIDYEPYSYATLDINGGTWKQVHLSSVEQIPIDAPADVASEAFKSELAAIKTAIATKSAGDTEIIKYWGNNPIVRWNEIARELAAKYNLIPPPNADGTYTLPDPANPSKFPFFPFCHPPYASRMYAYLSVSQFDALIATWHYKYKYGRPSLHKIDPSVTQSLQVSDLPSYPSDGAVIASVSKEILSAMFPLEKEYLNQKATEAQRALWISGLHVQSDIIAGDSLGRGIVKILLKRAANDGMKSAQTNKVISDSIQYDAFNRFGWKWSNQESPQRPVGLTPFFGKVKTWSVPNLVTVRPPIPPTPGSDEFNKAAEELKTISATLTKEQRRIANWWSDGLSTTTPPGHWNKFAIDFIIEYKLNPLRSARTLAYMNMAIQDAGISCWDAKYYYHYPRPIEAISGFKGILGTPNFPGYTSGHSTFSAAAAEVLGYIFPAKKSVVLSWSKEAAESRIYGGIHFRFDSEQGLIQGKKVADYTIQIAIKDGAD